MVGAGFMARGIALQMCGAVPGVKLAAISNRHIDGAKRAYEEAVRERYRFLSFGDAMLVC